MKSRSFDFHLEALAYVYRNKMKIKEVPIVYVYANSALRWKVVDNALHTWCRIWIGSDRMAEQALPPGMVLPQMVHGGPGRSGGGEELGGLRALEFYMQRTALQGFQGFLKSRFAAAGE